MLKACFRLVRVIRSCGLCGCFDGNRPIDGQRRVWPHHLRNPPLDSWRLPSNLEWPVRPEATGQNRPSRDIWGRHDSPVNALMAHALVTAQSLVYHLDNPSPE
jgi:hypothetical protein